MMKRMLLGLGAAIALWGCAERLGDQGDQGVVQLGQLTTDTRAEVVHVATKSDPLAGDPTYRLTIYRGTEAVKSFDDYTALGELQLKEGSYRFVVESGTQTVGAAIDAPYFYGEKSVSVTAGATTSVALTAKLANVRIAATVSQLIKDNFKDYSLSVLEVPLAKSDIIAGRSLYISGKLTSFFWILKLTNNQGTESTFYQEVKAVAPCSFYKFSFDIDNTAGIDQGQLMLNLTVDTSVEHFEEDIDISLEQHKLPATVAEGNFELDKQVVVNEVQRGMKMRVNLTAAAGIGSLKVRHTNPELVAKGIPMVFEASALDATTLAGVAAAGISWSPMLLGQSSAWIDVSALANTAPLGLYRFYLTIEDRTKQRVDVSVAFIVLPDQDHITGVAEAGAKYAVLNGEWCTLDRPEGLTFQYRLTDATEWTMIDPALMVNGAGKAFSVRIKGLSPTKSYTYRTYSPAAGDKQGNPVDFTTWDAPEIPNLSFDSTYWSGKNWYPNAKGGNSYWATGNEGVTMDILGMSSNNTDESTDLCPIAKPGSKAVRLKSVPITMGLSPVKFAGGSLFTGSYATNTSDPVSSVKFGRPYKGRPLALKGWYKYHPKTINTYKYDQDQWAMGTMDKCHIYISLEDWGGASARPGKPRVVGYGEIRSDAVVSNWSEFQIDIAYNDPTRTPTHVVVVATASHLGGTFCGGSGSELLVDEFSLVWE